MPVESASSRSAGSKCERGEAGCIQPPGAHSRAARAATRVVLSGVRLAPETAPGRAAGECGDRWTPHFDWHDDARDAELSCTSTASVCVPRSTGRALKGADAERRPTAVTVQQHHDRRSPRAGCGSRCSCRSRSMCSKNTCSARRAARSAAVGPRATPGERLRADRAAPVAAPAACRSARSCS